MIISFFFDVSVLAVSANQVRWNKFTSDPKQQDICSLLFFAHIVCLFSLSFWNLACKDFPVGDVMSKLRFGTLKSSSFKLYVTSWICWFSTVAVQDKWRVLCQLWSMTSKQNFFQKRRKVFLYYLCHSEEHMIRDFPHPWINNVNAFSPRDCL